MILEAGRNYWFLEPDGELTLWNAIQSHNRAVYGEHPSTYPSLLRPVREPGKVTPWRQPLDAFDAYRLINPFTLAPDRVTHNGQTWEVVQGDGAGNNIWEPGVFGWDEAP